MNNNISLLSNVAMCDAFIEKLESTITLIKIKHYQLQKRIDVHLRIVKRSEEEMYAKQIELKVLKDVLAQTIDERRVIHLNYRILKTESRIQLMKLKLYDYNSTQLTWKMFSLQQAETALNDAELLLAEVIERRAGLAEPKIQDEVADAPPPQSRKQPLLAKKSSVSRFRHPVKKPTYTHVITDLPLAKPAPPVPLIRT